MKVLIIVAVVLGVLALIGMITAVRIVKQYEKGVLFRFGRLRGSRAPGQRQRGRVGGRLLPGGRRGEIGRGDRERVRGDRPDRADHAAEGRGPPGALAGMIGCREPQIGSIPD